MILEKLTPQKVREYVTQELFKPKTNINVLRENCPGLIGVELESFATKIDKKPKLIRPHNLITKNKELENSLIPISKKFGGTTIYYQENPLADSSRLVDRINFDNGDSFQFEPGGQLEIATAAYDSFEKMRISLEKRQHILDQVSSESGIHFSQFGTNPWFNTEEIGLQLNKSRYQALQTYFNQIGDSGIRMMRQTCSIHVNLDLGKVEEVAIRRIIVANLLSPFVTAIFANSPILARKLTGKKSTRSELWSKLDPKRMKIFQISKDSSKNTKQSLIDQYTQFALEAPLIYIQKFGPRIFNQDLNHWLNQSINDYHPNLLDLKNHFSLLFPDVRWKGFLELRAADALPRRWQLTPAVFLTGILYSEAALDRVLEKLLPFAGEMNKLKIEAEDGLDSDVIFKLAQELMELAIGGFASLPPAFQSTKELQTLVTFNERYTSQRKVIADDWITLFQKNKLLIY
jgi:glutamate--cysteine ligase